MNSVGHSRLLKLLAPSEQMNKMAAVPKFNMDLLNPSIASEVLGPQTLREATEETLIPVIKTTKSETSLTKQDGVKLSKDGPKNVYQVINTAYNQIESEVIRGPHPLRTEEKLVHKGKDKDVRKGKGVHEDKDVTDGKDVTGKDGPEDKKARTKIPVLKFKQAVDKVTEHKKKTQVDDKTTSHQVPQRQLSRRSSIPKLQKVDHTVSSKTKARLDVRNGSEQEQVSKPEEEFDKIYDKTVEHKNEDIIKIDPNIDNVKIESEFEGMIHDYDEPELQPVDAVLDEIISGNDELDEEKVVSEFEKIIHTYEEPKIDPEIVEEVKKETPVKRTKIPSLKRRSQGDIKVNRRHSLKNGLSDKELAKVKSVDYDSRNNENSHGNNATNHAPREQEIINNVPLPTPNIDNTEITFKNMKPIPKKDLNEVIFIEKLNDQILKGDLIEEKQKDKSVDTYGENSVETKAETITDKNDDNYLPSLRGKVSRLIKKIGSSKDDKPLKIEKPENEIQERPKNKLIKSIDAQSPKKEQTFGNNATNATREEETINDVPQPIPNIDKTEITIENLKPIRKEDPSNISMIETCNDQIVKDDIKSVKHGQELAETDNKDKLTKIYNNNKPIDDTHAENNAETKAKKNTEKNKDKDLPSLRGKVSHLINKIHSPNDDKPLKVEKPEKEVQEVPKNKLMKDKSLDDKSPKNEQTLGNNATNAPRKSTLPQQTPNIDNTDIPVKQWEPQLKENRNEVIMVKTPHDQIKNVEITGEKYEPKTKEINNEDKSHETPINRENHFETKVKTITDKNDDNDLPSLKGKVSRLINKIRSSPNDEKPLNVEKSEIEIQERPKKKSVSSRIAMFEQKQPESIGKPKIPPGTATPTKSKYFEPKQPESTLKAPNPENMTLNIKELLISQVVKQEIKLNRKPEVVEQVLKQTMRQEPANYKESIRNKNYKVNDGHENIKDDVKVVECNDKTAGDVQDKNNFDEQNTLNDDLVKYERIVIEPAVEPSFIVEENTISFIEPNDIKKEENYKKLIQPESEERFSPKDDLKAFDSIVERRIKRLTSKSETDLYKSQMSIVDIELGGVVRGKVHNILENMKTVEKYDPNRTEVINAKERPRKKSVLEKIALFERKLTPIDMESKLETHHTNKTKTITVTEDWKENKTKNIPVSENSKENKTKNIPVSENSKENKTKNIPVFEYSKENKTKNIPVFEYSKENKTKTITVSENSKDSKTEVVTVSENAKEDYSTYIAELVAAKKKYGTVGDVVMMELNDGVRMPAVAVGTALLDPQLARYIVEAAIDLGYRAIDTAYIYGNEREVGEAIRNKIEDGTVQRSELFISSKLWSTLHRPDLVAAACRASLQALQLDYFDLYSIHNPMSFKEGGPPIPTIANVLQYSTHSYLDAWRAMQALVHSGLARSIGVSNFNASQLAKCIEKGHWTPSVNQVECHPYLNQDRLSAFCNTHGITLSCYGTLGSKGTPLGLKSDGAAAEVDDPRILKMAAELGVTAAQVLISYQLSRGHAVVVKASSAAHLRDNLLAQSVTLDDGMVQALGAMNRNKRNFVFKGMGDTHKEYPFNSAV